MKNVKLIGLILILLSCKSVEKKTPDTVFYGLKENVKFVSEKMIATIYDEYLDTTKSYFTIINRSFDKNGYQNLTEYFSEDSILLSWLKYDKNGHTMQFDKDGNQQNITKKVSVEDGVFYVETYPFKSEEVQQKTWTKLENGRMAWQKSIRVKDSVYFENVYYRNNEGLDTLVKSKFGYEISEDYHLTYVKYLSFDEKGNWTERLEYSLSDTNNYVVKQRRIEYYN
jgi:hypothetical protein